MLLSVMFLAVYLASLHPVRAEAAPVDTRKEAEAGDIARKEDDGKGGAAAEGTLSAADKTHAFVSKRIVSISDRLDAFFGDERMDVETNRTKVRLNLVSLIDEKGKYTFKTNVAATLILPRTQRRFKLIIEDTQDALPDNDESGLQAQNRLIEAFVDTTLSTAFRYLLIDTKKYNIQLDLGVRTKTPIDPFTRLRIRRTYFFRDWESRLVYSFKWPFSKKWEAATSAAFDHPVGERFLFRFGNVASRRRTEEGVRFSHDFSLFQKLPEEAALVYFSGMKWVDRPRIHATSYRFGVTYRRRLFRPWCFFQVRPLGAFPEEARFDFTPSVTFKIEFIFGGLDAPLR